MASLFLVERTILLLVFSVFAERAHPREASLPSLPASVQPPHGGSSLPMVAGTPLSPALHLWVWNLWSLSEEAGLYFLIPW